MAEFIKKQSYFVTPTGSNIRGIGNEGLQTFYALTKNPNKNSKIIPRSDVEYFLSVPPEKYTFTLFTNTFSNRHDRKNNKIIKSKYETNDIVVLKPGDYFNTKEIVTTLGRLFYNKIIIDACGMKDTIGYINDELTKKNFSSVEKNIASNITENKISTSQMIKYINHRDWIGYQFYAVICSSFTSRTINLPKEVVDRKKELLKKYEKEIKAGDPKVTENIEKELVSLTEKILEDDPGMDFFKSGSKVSTGNNLKNIIIMRGAVMNPITGEYDIITNSFLDGMEKEKFNAHSNALILGAYPKACGGVCASC